MHARSSLVRSLASFAFFALLLFSPWLVRTAVASGGNPVFPLATGLLGGGHFDAAQAQRFDVAHAPRADQQSLGARATALWQQVGADYHYAGVRIAGVSVPVGLLLLGVVIVLAVRDREARRWLALLAGNVLVWLFATHLQGRFLVQCVPIAGMLAACAVRPTLPRATDQYPDPCPPSAASDRQTLIRGASIALIAIAAACLSWPAPLSTLQKSLPALAVPGEPESLRELLPNDVARAVYDTDRPVVLVGDAKAFWYAIPSSRLRYRSVFDVRGTGSVRDAWLGEGMPADALVVVDPSELRRFARTYRNLPAIPDAWRERDEAFVLQADDVP